MVKNHLTAKPPKNETNLNVHIFSITLFILVSLFHQYPPLLGSK